MKIRRLAQPVDRLVLARPNYEVLHGLRAAEIPIRRLTVANIKFVIETFVVVLAARVLAGVGFPIRIRARDVDVHVAEWTAVNFEHHEKIVAVTHSDSIANLGDVWRYHLVSLICPNPPRPPA
jgi:hypothetical protein